ncbi:unnamed protein product, partial [marine sediment metagenome]
MQEKSTQLSDTVIEAWLRLTLVSGVGPRILAALIAQFHSPQAVLNAAEDELRRVEGVGPQLARAIATADRTTDPAAEWAVCQQEQIQVLAQTAEDYPQSLLEIPDPPGVLFLQGELKSADSIAI